MGIENVSPDNLKAGMLSMEQYEEEAKEWSRVGVMKNPGAVVYRAKVAEDRLCAEIDSRIVPVRFLQRQEKARKSLMRCFLAMNRDPSKTKLLGERMHRLLFSFN